MHSLYGFYVGACNIYALPGLEERRQIQRLASPDDHVKLICNQLEPLFFEPSLPCYGLPGGKRTGKRQAVLAFDLVAHPRTPLAL
jgi:hypothetical protein